MLSVISLGAGVQSSVMALMAAHGELTPMPDCAIFSDTGAEPRYVYEWLDWLETQLPFPVHRVMWKQGLLENIKESVAGGRFASPPFFTESDSQDSGRLWRQCTSEFKIQPIERFIRRELLNLEPSQRGPKEIAVEQWMGISTDEMQRMKDSRLHFIRNRFPLIESRMSRSDCLRWMADKGYPMPQKSSCTFCPYHDDAFWRDMKLTDPESWQQAVEVDELIRAGVRGTTQKLYLHRSLTPLVDVDFRNAADFGQMDMFEEECDGMCGV
jgi:hypothetical protein